MREAVHVTDDPSGRSAAAANVFRGEVGLSSTQMRRPVLALLALALALALSASLPPASRAETGGASELENAPTLGNTAFDRQGMWIWYVSKSEGGSVAAIIARAKRNRIGTVYIKSGDGSTTWSQFNKQLVTRLHRGGLDVCAWQFVYGDHPAAEARVGAVSVQRGADCLVIDAEGDYEGKYASADRYIRSLRAQIGATFPLSLAGFPYVDYHPSFPYSVFFGPGGATYNQPQMYWKTIGTSVRAVYEHTYLFNRIWGHPIYPIGQTYEAPGNGPLMLFRRFAASYGNLPPSWWDWQETTGGEWGALGAASALRPVTGYRTTVEHPLLKKGSRGRHGGLGAGAPDRRRRGDPGDGDIWSADADRGAGLPGSARAGSGRGDRDDDLGRAAEGRPVPDELGGAGGAAGDGAGEPGRGRAAAAVGIAAGEGVRDSARAAALGR